MMKLNFNKICFMVVCFFVLGCDSLDTSYKIDKTQPPPQKSTTCTVDFAKTCWVDTMKKITSCLSDDRDGTFSFDKKFCTNQQQMLVDFANPIAMFERPYDVFSNPVDFRVLSNSKDECFRLQGTRTNFTIAVAESGQTVHFENDGQNIRFNCLDGQEIMVDAKNVEGCTDKFGADSVPGLSLDPWSEQKVEAGWQLHLRGAGLEPVFRCRF